MYLRSHEKACDSCLRPAGRRLGLFQARDDYECYAEGYVKCFWGLCDRPHISHESIVKKNNGSVVTIQPMRQELPFKDPLNKNLRANKFQVKM